MEKTDKRALTVASAMMLLAALGNPLLGSAAALLIPLGMSADAATLLLTVIFEGVFLCVPALLLSGDGKRRAAPTFGQFLRGILLGATLVFALNVVSVLWALAMERLGLTMPEGGVSPAKNGNALMGQVLLIGAVPGICEELFFRDFLFGKLERVGTKRALLLTSVFFALLHGDLWGFPVQLLAGLALCRCALATDSVYVSMAAHTTYNSVVCVLMFLQRDTEDVSSVTRYVAESGGVLPFLLSLALYGAVACFLLRGLSKNRNRESDMPPATMNPLAATLFGVAALFLVGLSLYGTGVFG